MMTKNRREKGVESVTRIVDEIFVSPVSPVWALDGGHDARWEYRWVWIERRTT